MAGDADDPILADQRPRLRISHIILPDMDAVRAELRREIGTVVQDEGDARGLRDRYQHIGGAADVVVSDILHAQLQRGDVTGAQRRFQLLGKRTQCKRRRRDEIEPAARAHAACFSTSGFHSPSVARLFIRARCAKARCAAATLADFPPHAFCGAACSARP